MNNREKALETYYLNPQICLCCGKIIEVKEGVTASETRRKKFCNQSCAASFNNKGINRKSSSAQEKSINPLTICPNCGAVKTPKAKMCSSCYQSNRDVGNRTLGSYIDGEKYLTSKCQEIRRHARKILETSSIVKSCAYCKNEELSEILEVHHIKSILEFSSEITLNEINFLDNLV